MVLQEIIPVNFRLLFLAGRHQKHLNLVFWVFQQLQELRVRLLELPELVKVKVDALDVLVDGLLWLVFGEHRALELLQGLLVLK